MQETINKNTAIERAKYLLASLDRVRNLLHDQTTEHAETCMLTGKATSMCLAHFSNLERICNEVIKSIEKIEEKGT
jgi:hypothetical protein